MMVVSTDPQNQPNDWHTLLPNQTLSYTHDQPNDWPILLTIPKQSTSPSATHSNTAYNNSGYIPGSQLLWFPVVFPQESEGVIYVFTTVTLGNPDITLSSGRLDLTNRTSNLPAPGGNSGAGLHPTSLGKELLFNHSQMWPHPQYTQIISCCELLHPQNMYCILHFSLHVVYLKSHIMNNTFLGV